MPSVSRIAEREALQVEMLTTESEFVALAEPWNAVAEHVARPSVFLTYEWFRAAWAWRRHDAQLRIFTVRDQDGHLVGILPLMSDCKAGGLARKLLPLAVPDTQTFDLIALPARRREVCAALAQALAARRDWDHLHMNYIAPDGDLGTGLVAAFAAMSLPGFATVASRNAYIGLDGEWASFYGTRTRSLKKANNLAGNRFGKAGVVRVAQFGPGHGDKESLAPLLHDVIDVSRRSWKQTTGNSLDREGPGDFIRSLSAAAQARGWLSIWLAYLDDKPVAMEYQLVYAGNVHALRADFDSACNEVSPGSFLFRFLLERLFGTGLARYFMGPGDNAYKARWTDLSEPVCVVSVYHRTVRGRLYRQWEQNMKPRLRELRNRLATKPDPASTTSNNAPARTI